MGKYKPVLLSCEMNKYGYWVTIWSVKPGLRLAVTVTRVGISRSEAQDLARETLSLVTPDA